MNINKKNITLSAIIGAIILIGCTQNTSELSWEEAINTLNSGNVVSVGQSHSLEVAFTLKDGNIVNTIEPTIDAIFDEVDKCGDICSNMLLYTE